MRNVNNYGNDVSIDVDGVGHVYRVHSVVTNTYDDENDEWLVETGHTVYITPADTKRKPRKRSYRITRDERTPLGIALFSMGVQLRVNEAANITHDEYIDKLEVFTYMRNLTLSECGKTWQAVRDVLGDTIVRMIDEVHRRSVLFAVDEICGEGYCE